MSELEDNQNANETVDVAVPAAEALPPTAQDTPKILENQEKPGIAADSARDSLESRLIRRHQAIDDLLREKEALQLSYVTRKTPKAYYLRWKAECNRIFFLDMSLRRRVQRSKGKG